MGLSRIIKECSYRTIKNPENQIFIQNNSISSILSTNDFKDQPEKDLKIQNEVMNEQFGSRLINQKIFKNLESETLNTVSNKSIKIDNSILTMHIQNINNMEMQRKQNIAIL